MFKTDASNVARATGVSKRIKRDCTGKSPAQGRATDAADVMPEQWFGLADEELQDATYDSQTIREG